MTRQRDKQAERDREAKDRKLKIDTASNKQRNKRATGNKENASDKGNRKRGWLGQTLHSGEKIVAKNSGQTFLALNPELEPKWLWIQCYIYNTVL